MVRVKLGVRVWIRNQGTRAVKLILRDRSLAGDLVKPIHSELYDKVKIEDLLNLPHG